MAKAAAGPPKAEKNLEPENPPPSGPPEAPEAHPDAYLREVYPDLTDEELEEIADET